MAKVKIPRAFKARLKEAGRAHGYKGADDFGMHLITKGVAQYEGAAANARLDEQLTSVADTMGYSSVDELLEHLLERGLAAYATDDGDPEAFAARLRGLGYLE